MITESCVGNGAIAFVVNLEPNPGDSHHNNEHLSIIDEIGAEVWWENVLDSSTLSDVADTACIEKEIQYVAKEAPSPPPPAPPPTPPPPSLPPFTCTLDFASKRYSMGQEVFSTPDNILTTEFELLERFSYLSSSTDSYNDYWCSLQDNPYYICLDIGSPSTLANTYVDELELSNTLAPPLNELSATPNYFGQYDQCGGKGMGDGIINILDITVLMSYLFKTGPYSSLSDEPSTITTTEGRENMNLQCDNSQYTERIDWIREYSLDSCNLQTFSNPPPSAPGGRRLQSIIARDVLTSSEWSKPARIEYFNRENSHEISPIADIVPSSYEPRQLSRANVSVTKYGNYQGSWYTFETRDYIWSLSAKLRGINFENANIVSDMSGFDPTEIPETNTTDIIFKISRYCEYSNNGCSSTDCAGILWGSQYNDRSSPIMHNTIELFQDDVYKACPFRIHLWVPYSRESDCVGIDYILAANGRRGSFTESTACARFFDVGISPPPPPQASSPLSNMPPPPPVVVITPSSDPVIVGLMITLSILSSASLLLSIRGVMMKRSESKLNASVDTTVNGESQLLDGEEIISEIITEEEIEED